MSSRGAKAKDASARQHERNQTILADLLRSEQNRFCADCAAKGPRWASWNLGVFMCIRCAGIHRNLGVHISRVKSVNLDSWTPEQIESIQAGGNGRAKEVYEANLPSGFRRPQDDYAVEMFIRNKYERKLYATKTPDKRQEPDKPKEPEKTRGKREARAGGDRKSAAGGDRKSGATCADKTKSDQASLPRPMHASARSPSLTPLTQAPPTSLLVPTPPPKVHSAPDLISLDTGHTSSQDLLSDPVPPGPAPSTQPELVMDSGGDGSVKDSIMSLYQRQAQPSFTPAGRPLYHYQAQQAAALRMAQQQQQQQQQQLRVAEVQRQMEQLKAGRPQQTVGTANGGPGQSTLNPTLW